MRVLFLSSLVCLACVVPLTGAVAKPSAVAKPATPTEQKMAAILGPDAATCAPDSMSVAVLVHVRGLKDTRGRVRLELYSDHAEDFLKSGAALEAQHRVFRRIDVPTPAGGQAYICMALPEPGRYSMAVLHDRNNNGKLDIMNDGFGFPGNPKLSWAKPKVQQAMFAVDSGVGHLDVLLNYVAGLSVKPIGGRHTKE